MIKYIYALLLFVGCLFIKAQNPSTILIASVQAVTSIDTYTRATTSINLKPGFKYGFINSGATNLFNLSISSYSANIISPNYSDPSLNPFAGYNSNLGLGGSEGDYQVSPTGQFSYNLPIICSPGTNGMEPKVTVNYSSTGINGLMGVGFNLSGISAISRTGKNKFSDGKSSDINLSNQDFFAMDGSRMFLNTGTNYGDNGATYVLQSINHQTITSINTAGTGPQYFIVKDPKGYTMEFGNTSDSKLIANSDNSVLSWYINKITDEFGNYMTYSYNNTNNGEVNIDKIEYTINNSAGLQAYNKIQFNYIDRSDKNTVFYGGKPYNTSKLLQSIVSKDANNQPVRSYFFEYQFSVYSLLYKITEADADGNQLNPIVFTWGEPGINNPSLYTQQSFQFLITGNNLNNIKSVSAPDLNGDGYADLVGVASNDAYTTLYQSATIIANVGAQLNDMPKGGLPELTFSQASNVISLTAPTNYTAHLGTFICDKEMDGKQEVYVMSQHFDFPYHYYYMVDEIKYNTTSNSLLVSNVYDGSNNLCGQMILNSWTAGSPNPFFFDIKDYNNDGLNDMLIIDQLAIRFKPGTGVNTYGAEVITNFPLQPIMPKVGDFDADGRLDIFMFRWTGNPTLTVTANGQNEYAFDVYKIDPTTNAFTIAYSSGTIVKSNHDKLSLGTFDVGDFNGDGKTDVFSTQEGNFGITKVHESTGTGFNNITLTMNEFNYNDVVEVIAEDLNGDNKCDLIIKKFTAFDSNNLPTASVYNALYSFGKDVIPDYGNYSQSESKYCSTFGDFNADGNSDYFVSFLNPDYQYIRYSHLYNQKKHFLTKIQSPKRTLDVEYSFSKSAYDYNTLTLVSNSLFKVYETKNTQLNSNFVLLNPSIYLVSKLTDNNKPTRYNYVNAIVNKGGQTPSYQFLGFEQFKSGLRDLNPVVSSMQHLGSITSYTYDPSFNTISDKVTVNGIMNMSGTNYLGGNNVINNSNNSNDPNSYYVLKSFYTVNPISKSTEKYSRTLYPTQTLNSQIFYNSQITNADINYLSSTNNTSILIIDNTKQGNIASRTNQSYVWNSSVPFKSSTHTYLFTLANGNYKISTDVTNIIQQNNPPYTHTVDYNYDGSGRLVSKINDAQNSQAVTTNYLQYDNVGNATQIQVTAADITTRTTSKSFDPTGRFVIQSTNSIGNTESNVYDPKFGNIVSSTDISGLTTTYKYNGMGMLVETKLPNNTTNGASYIWDNSAAFSGSYSITTFVEGAAKTIKLFDKNDNLLQTETDGFGGSAIVSTSSYDNWDRLLAKTDDHFITQNKFKKMQCIYNDPFYRITQIQNINYENNFDYPLNAINYSYNLPSTDSYYSKAFTMTSQTSASVSSNFNSIKKETNVAGQTDKVYNYNGALPQKTADYTFFSNGQPKNITLNFPDGSTSLTQFVYDNLGRQATLIDQSAGTTAYTYNSVGELLTETTANGTYTYQYDALGRIVSKTGSAMGSTSYQYVTTANGRQNIEIINGPNNTTEFKYDILGRVIEQKETIGPKILKTNYAYDKYGHIVSHIFPNNYSVDYTYDNIGNQIQIKQGNLIIWEQNSQFAPGLIDNFSYNNGSKTTALNYYGGNSYELYQVNSKTFGSGATQDYGQLFDYDFSGTHSIYRRSVSRDFVSNYTGNGEFFEYDDVNRLKSVRSGYYDPPFQTINYKDNGNIMSKTDAGTYIYNNPSTPYNLSNINNPTNNIDINTLSITYNDIKKVSQISQMGSNKLMTFIYGNNNQRCRMDYLDPSSSSAVNQYTRYYTTDYDRQEDANGYKEWNYINSPTGLAAVYYNNNGNGQLLYVTTDKLESPLLLTNSAGQVVEEYSFDAWGRRRNPVDWSFNNVPVPQYMIRGFTGHEMLDEFAMINMNGRIYDPVVGRFLQPDNLVQDGEDFQTFNRYAYCRNNPIKYTDPSGNDFGWDDAIVLGVGFIVGDISYGVTHGGDFKHLGVFFSGKALAAGAITAGLAELGYLTLGGGDIAVGAYSSLGEDGAAVTSSEIYSNAGTYAINFTANEAIDISANKDQISNAKGWDGVWLIGGYGLAAGLQTGFTSGPSEELIDGSINYQLGFAPDEIVFGTFKGVSSDFIGGALNAAGVTVLQSYKPQSETWGAIHWGWDKGEGVLGQAAVGGIAQSIGKIVGNGFDILSKKTNTNSFLLTKAAWSNAVGSAVNSIGIGQPWNSQLTSPQTRIGTAGSASVDVFALLMSIFK